MHLHRWLVSLALVFIAGTLGRGADPPIVVEANEDVSRLFPGAPRLQSFAFAEWQGHWIFLAGRVSGYHGEGGKEADFPRAEANNRVWVLTVPDAGQPVRTWSLPLTKLPPVVVDQWMSTNPQYTQVGERLYIAGGYGQNAAGKWVTYPILSAVHLPGLVQAVKQQGDLAAHVRYSESPHVQVSGGELLRLDDGLFYLAGGHKFTGSYRDFETTRGQDPALASQEYTSAVRQLRIDAATLNVELVTAFTHPEFRRRDMNAGHVVMPDGKTLGAALYGGVFTASQLGFTKPVYWTAQQPPQPFAGFDQKMSAYTCAHLGLFDPDEGATLRTFFGGISGWLWNHEKGALEPAPRQGDRSAAVYRDGLQWIDRITTLMRHRDGQHVEWVQPSNRLAGYLGANAVFLPARGMQRLRPDADVFDARPLRGRRTLAGYIFGGIRAFPRQFPYTDDAPDYRSGNVPTRASEMVIAVYVTLPAREHKSAR